MIIRWFSLHRSEVSLHHRQIALEPPARKLGERGETLVESWRWDLAHALFTRYAMNPGGWGSSNYPGCLLCIECVAFFVRNHMKINRVQKNVGFNGFYNPIHFCKSLLLLLILTSACCHRGKTYEPITYFTLARPIAKVRQERVDVAFKGGDLLFFVIQEFAQDPGRLSIEFDGTSFLHATITDEGLRLIDLQSTPNRVIVMEDGNLISASNHLIKGDQIDVILNDRRRWIDQVLPLVRGG